ncbi:LAQU0S05e03092g1_1 [Lachancea quebecensis]|uniref:LAQU0S05e03092g1_1 n=1 Tax=Lachancea quebecensis TaxID=1654605 RepID=A0A0P1KRQ0_9SACH|nr:LAQU0S05e03092g1_1 [Lachancea quebecensis]
MDFFNRAYQNLYDTFAGIDAAHAIRLVIIVGGYLLFRNLTQKHLAKKQLEQKLRKSEEAKAAEKQKELVADPQDDETIQDNAFGWGNKTRKRVKRQEKILEERLQELEKLQGSQDDDKDIEDLLED